MKNIIIRLEEDVLKFYEDLAIKTNRSRKKEIEILVTSFAFNKLMDETCVKVPSYGFDSVQFGEDGPKYKVPNKTLREKKKAGEIYKDKLSNVNVKFSKKGGQETVTVSGDVDINPKESLLNITVDGKKLPKNQFKVKDKTITLEKPLSRTEQMKKLRK